MVSWGEILSSEGRTQGEPIAKTAYTLGILPLIKFLLEFINLKNKNAKEVAFAGDFPVTDSLNSIKNYHDNSTAIGPKYGYFPKLTKSLVVKENNMIEAQNLFANSRVKGERQRKEKGTLMQSSEVENIVMNI